MGAGCPSRWTLASLSYPVPGSPAVIFIDTGLVLSVFLLTHSQIGSKPPFHTLAHNSRPCCLHSPADIATITLDQDDVRQGVPCGSLR